MFKLDLKSAEVVEKSWGREYIIDNRKETNYCLKILCYDKAGRYSSCHKHYKKSETFCVLSGKFHLISFNYDIDNILKDFTSKTLEIGERVFIKVDTYHQLIPLEDESSVVEVSTYHQDDDIYRITESYKSPEV